MFKLNLKHWGHILLHSKLKLFFFCFCETQLSFSTKLSEGYAWPGHFSAAVLPTQDHLAHLNSPCLFFLIECTHLAFSFSMRLAAYYCCHYYREGKIANFGNKDVSIL